MRGSEHVGIAVLTTGAALYAMGNGHIEISAGAAVAAAAIGSLVPDIDHPKAWISNRIPATLAASGLVFLLWFGWSNWYVSRPSSTVLGASLWIGLVDSARPLLVWAVIALVLGIALLILAHAVASLVGHRGPTHSLAVGAALTLIACIGFAVLGASWTLGLWFGWGYLSHLLADLITPMGCPALLWPLGSGDLSALQGAGPKLPVRATVARSGSSLNGISEQGASASGPSLPNGLHADAPDPAVVADQADGAGMEPQLVDGTQLLAQGSPRTCPECGGALVQREARRGAHVGNKFYGCANYPKCRHIENMA